MDDEDQSDSDHSHTSSDNEEEEEHDFTNVHSTLTHKALTERTLLDSIEEQEKEKEEQGGDSGDEEGEGETGSLVCGVLVLLLYHGIVMLF